MNNQSGQIPTTRQTLVVHGNYKNEKNKIEELQLRQYKAPILKNIIITYI